MTSTHAARKIVDLGSAGTEEVSPQERALYHEFQSYTTAICDVVFAETASKLHRALENFTGTVDDRRTSLEKDLVAQETRHADAVGAGIARTATALHDLRQEGDTLLHKWDAAVHESLARFADTAFLDAFNQHTEAINAAVGVLERAALVQSERIEAIEALQRRAAADLDRRSRLTLLYAAFVSILCLALILSALRG